MNIASLQTFLAVVQAGNLNKAAEQLNVTQSTVTTRLDVLEGTLGQKLLIRSRRGAALTRAGFAFQRHAEVMVQEWDQARKAVGLPRGYSGLFSFACEPDLWEGAGEVWLERIRAQQPELALEAWEAGAGDIRRWLASGLIDAGLVSEPISGAGFISRQAGVDRLVQVATVARKAQSWDPAYVYVDLGPQFRRQHALAWPGEDTARMTFSSSRWALDHLLREGGSAYLPWRIVEQHVRAGRLYPVDGAHELVRPLSLVWREESLPAHPWLERELSLEQIAS